MLLVITELVVSRNQCSACNNRTHCKRESSVLLVITELIVSGNQCIACNNRTHCKREPV